jgi:hypothetical protein
MIADIMTKALPPATFIKFRNLLLLNEIKENN